MPVIRERAEVRVHGVKVGSGIAVIGHRHSAIGSDRGGPNRRDAELLQVVQMLLDAGKVSAMPAANGSAIAGGGIVGRVPVGETVGHDQVKHIGGRKAAVAIGPMGAFGQHVGAA